MRWLKPVHLYALGWVVLVVGLVWYVNTATSATVNCMYRAQAQDSVITSLRSDAAERRDDALVRSKLTMARLAQVRVGDSGHYSPVLVRMWQKYLHTSPYAMTDQVALSRQYTQTVIDYVQAQQDLDTVRDKNPPPNIRRMCG